MSTGPADLSALLGARMCHDLISPIGAISNGVELLQLSGADSPELTLISQAVNNANQRIRYFRVAFGSAPIGQKISPAEIAKILTPDAFGPKLNLNWQPQEDIEKREVKLAFLTLLCLETCMPYGGAISVARLDGKWRISGHADRLKAVPELWEHLTQSDPEMPLPAPAQLQFTLLGHELTQHNRRADVNVHPTEIIVTF